MNVVSGVTVTRRSPGVRFFSAHAASVAPNLAERSGSASAAFYRLRLAAP